MSINISLERAKMQVLQHLVGKSMGLFDSATGKSLQITGAVDITDELPRRLYMDESVHLEYTRAKKGVIVRIRILQQGQTTGGASVHYCVADLDDFSSDMGNNFAERAHKRIGVPAERLRELITLNIPLIS